MTDSARRRQLLQAYEERRIAEQIAYHRRRLEVSQRGRRQLLDCSTLLYTLTAFLGAMAASSLGSRSMWAVLAAATGAGASALTGYAMMAGFERNEEQSRQVLASLTLLDASHPEPVQLDQPEGGEALSDYVHKVEAVLQHDVELWARASADAAAQASDRGEPAARREVAPE